MSHWEPMLEQVMRERSARLLAYAAMVTGNDAEAHDVLQEALVRSFSRRRRFEHLNAAEAYVRRAIPSAYLDRVRRRRTRERAIDRAFEREPGGVDVDARVDVQRALATLGPRERACMVLRFYDDLTVPQIAHELGIAEGTVKRYLSDAGKRLAALLGTEHEEPADDGPTVSVVPAAKGGR